jgi:tetratricopeptide (TPR) repeat protein
MPSLPVALGLAAGLLALGRRLSKHDGPSVPTFAPLVAFVILQGAFAQGAAAAYRSDSRLWSVALQRAPHSARAHAIAGELLVARMQGDENLANDPTMRSRASALCANAIRLDPRYEVGYLCRARLAALDRAWAGAHRDFVAALQLQPARSDRVLAALASVTLDLPDLPYPERVDRAFAHLDRALREFPYSPEVVAVAARLEHRLGRPEKAAAHYRRASRLRPERWDLVLAGLELLLDLGHPSAAWQAWHESEDLLEQADPARRNAVRRRLFDARRLFTPSPFDDPETSQRVTHDS